MAGISNTQLLYQWHPNNAKCCSTFFDLKKEPMSQDHMMKIEYTKEKIGIGPVTNGIEIRKEVQVKKKRVHEENIKELCTQPDLISFSSSPMHHIKYIPDTLKTPPKWKNFRISNEVAVNSKEFQPSNYLASSIIVNLESTALITPKQKGTTDTRDVIIPKDDYNSSDTSESISEISPLSQFDEEDIENQHPHALEWANFVGSTSNDILENQQQGSGLTWAKWSEKRSPYNKMHEFETAFVSNEERRRVLSKKESSEEVLIRKVQSTAKLWDNMKEIPHMSLLDGTRFCIPPGKGFVGQHSQGLGGHYTETFLIKKRKFP